MGTPALPLCHVSLKAPKPLFPKYPKELNRLGDHMRKRRMDLGLFQREVASRIGVSEATIYNWEGNKTSPQIRHIPKIIQFLVLILISRMIFYTQPYPIRVHFAFPHKPDSF